MGLTLGLDEAKAMRIKGQLHTIEGRSVQGYYDQPSRDAPGLDVTDRVYAACYHVIANEIVDADTASDGHLGDDCRYELRRDAGPAAR